MTAGDRFGAPLALDQCPACGGIWFDRYELFRIGEEGARRLEGIDEESFRQPAGTAENPLCPVCRVKLRVFRDANVPANIQLFFCSRCEGFWVNHGMLAEYASFRASRGRKRPDPRMAEDYERMLRSASDAELMEGIAAFAHEIGGPRDFLTGLPLDGTPEQAARIDRAQDFFYAAMGVAVRLLFWWL